MDCKRVSKTIYLFFDNELEDELLRPFRHHVDGCPGCARRVDHTRKVLLLVRKCCHRECAPESLRARILTSLPHRLAQSEQQAH